MIYISLSTISSVIVCKAHLNIFKDKCPVKNQCIYFIYLLLVFIFAVDKIDFLLYFRCRAIWQEVSTRLKSSLWCGYGWSLYFLLVVWLLMLFRCCYYHFGLWKEICTDGSIWAWYIYIGVVSWLTLSVRFILLFFVIKHVLWLNINDWNNFCSRGRNLLAILLQHLYQLCYEGTVVDNRSVLLIIPLLYLLDEAPQLLFNFCMFWCCVYSVAFAMQMRWQIFSCTENLFCKFTLRSIK